MGFSTPVKKSAWRLSFKSTPKYCRFSSVSGSAESPICNNARKRLVYARHSSPSAYNTTVSTFTSASSIQSTSIVRECSKAGSVSTEKENIESVQTDGNSKILLSGSTGCQRGQSYFSKESSNQMINNWSDQIGVHRKTMNQALSEADSSRQDTIVNYMSTTAIKGARVTVGSVRSASSSKMECGKPTSGRCLAGQTYVSHDDSSKENWKSVYSEEAKQLEDLQVSFTF